jgi:Protein of unknown function (DUF455)
MVELRPADTKQVKGMTLRRDPLREDCFSVVNSDAEMQEWPGMTEISMRERLHRHMNNETGAIEIAAQCLVDFPEAPWELRMQLARQCWDESRHVASLYRRLREIGGYKGEFPISNFEWTVTCSLDSLAARLALQNRTFEAGELDLLGQLPAKWREAGDEKTAEVLESILSDEITHVRFANQWLKRMVQEDRRILLKIATAVRFLSAVTAAVAPKEGELSPSGQVFTQAKDRIQQVNIEDRRHAEFSDSEIDEFLRQSGFQSIMPAGAEG